MGADALATAPAPAPAWGSKYTRSVATLLDAIEEDVRALDPDTTLYEHVVPTHLAPTPVDAYRIVRALRERMPAETVWAVWTKYYDRATVHVRPFNPEVHTRLEMDKRDAVLLNKGVFEPLYGEGASQSAKMWAHVAFVMYTFAALLLMVTAGVVTSVDEAEIAAWWSVARAAASAADAASAVAAAPAVVFVLAFIVVAMAACAVLAAAKMHRLRVLRAKHKSIKLLEALEARAWISEMLAARAAC